MLDYNDEKLEEAYTANGEGTERNLDYTKNLYITLMLSINLFFAFNIYQLIHT